MISLALAYIFTDAGPTGDSMSDLSKALAEVSKRSSIVVMPTYDKVTVAAEPKIVDDLVEPLRKAGFASLVSDVPVIYQAGIPQSHLGVLKGLVNAAEPQKSSFKEVTIPATAVKDNLITFETKPGEAIKVNTLMNLDLPKRIMVSPYFSFDGGQDFPLAISAKNMGAADFVRALTRGLSGKLAVADKTYTIGFDATTFRANMAKVLVLAQKGVDAGRTPSGINAQFNGGSYSDFQEYQDAAQPAQSSTKQSLTAAITLLGQTISKMNDQSLEQTFAYKGTSTRLSLATFTSLQEFAVSYLKSSAVPQSGQQNGTNVQRQQPGQRNSNLAALVNRVDPQDPGRLVITTDFRMSLELNLRGRGPQGIQPQNADPANKITIQVL